MQMLWVRCILPIVLIITIIIYFCYKLSPTILCFKTSLELFVFSIRKHTLRFNFRITKGWNGTTSMPGGFHQIILLGK